MLTAQSTAIRWRLKWHQSGRGRRRLGWHLWKQAELTEKLELVEVEVLARYQPTFNGGDVAVSYPDLLAGWGNAFTGRHRQRRSVRSGDVTLVDRHIACFVLAQMFVSDVRECVGELALVVGDRLAPSKFT
jgi:hypothetical protein